MNLALDGLSYITNAIADVQLSRIKHISVKDESTDTIIKIEPSEYVEGKLEFYFITPGNPDKSMEELLNETAPF